MTPWEGTLSCGVQPAYVDDGIVEASACPGPSHRVHPLTHLLFPIRFAAPRWMRYQDQKYPSSGPK